MKKSNVFLAVTGLVLTAAGAFAKKTGHQYSVATKGSLGNQCNLVNSAKNSVTKIEQTNKATSGGRTLYTSTACAVVLWTIADQ